MIRINLLPTRQARRKEAGVKQLAILGLCVLAVLGGNYWWYAGLDSDLGEKRRQISRLQREISQLEEIIGEISNISAEKEAIAQKLAVLDQLRRGRTGPVKLLDALATLMPERVWLVELESAGNQLKLKGGAVNHDDLADFISELRKNPMFGEVVLRRAVQTAETAGHRYVDFELTCTFDLSA